MFRTVIEEIKSPFKIAHQDLILTMGSCFSQEMGGKLAENKFNTSVNSLGTIFNPLSIFELLELSMESSLSIEEAMLERDGQFYNHKFHSSFNAESNAALLSKINNRLAEVKSDLTKAKVLFITFGTAWVYESLENQTLVANCHKIPKKHFNKRLLELKEIVDAFFNLKENIQAINPEIQIVLTVSPVRHTKDSLTLNSASKSLLRLACHYLSDMAAGVHYFPSYEIVMDDLRDYRFYEKDMIHLNEQGLDYIWEVFSKTFFSKATQTTNQEWQKITQSLGHRPFNSSNPKHQKFLRSTLDKLQNLNDHLDVKSEIEQVKSQLTNG